MIGKRLDEISKKKRAQGACCGGDAISVEPQRELMKSKV